MTTGYICVDCGEEILEDYTLSFLDEDLPIHTQCKDKIKTFH